MFNTIVTLKYFFSPSIATIAVSVAISEIFSVNKAITRIFFGVGGGGVTSSLSAVGAR